MKSRLHTRTRAWIHDAPSNDLSPPDTSCPAVPRQVDNQQPRSDASSPPAERSKRPPAHDTQKLADRTGTLDLACLTRPGIGQAPGGA
jgi:hypothetical protein